MEEGKRKENKCINNGFKNLDIAIKDAGESKYLWLII
jgi:hypothetical protein